MEQAKEGVRVEKGEPKDAFGKDVANLLDIFNEIGDRYFQSGKANIYASALTSQFAHLLSMLEPETAKALAKVTLETSDKIRADRVAKADA